MCSTLVCVTAFALMVMMRPPSMTSQSGLGEISMSRGLSPRSTAVRAVRASTPTDRITRSMVACSKTMASSDRSTLRGTPLVPPVVAGAASHL